MHTGLVRRLSFVDGLAIGVGSVVGTGIFRTTGTVLRGAGGVAGATLVWVACAVVAGAGALLFADMAGRVPEAGGPYAYVREAFGRRAAFVDGWLNGGVIIPTRQAAGIAVTGEVMAKMTGFGEARLWAALALFSLTAVTLGGVRTGALLQRVLTGSKLLIVAFVAALAWAARHRGVPTPSEALPPALPLVVALSGAFYTYLGWQDVVMLAEELRDPQRHLRGVLLGTVATVSVLYLTVHAALLAGLGDGAAARGDLPTVTLAGRLLGAAGETVVSAALLVSMLGGAAESILVRPRLLFALGRDGLGPAALAQTDAGGTPRRATLLHAAIVLLLVLSGTFERLLTLLVVAQSAALLVEASAYYVLRRRAAAPPTSSNVAAAVFTGSQLALAGATAWAKPGAAVAVLLGAGLLALVYNGRRPLATAASARPEVPPCP